MNFTQPRRERMLSGMANNNEKNQGNAPGKYYVDASCIDCDLCRDAAPATFMRNDEVGQSIAYRQPVTPEEILMAAEALASCPTESIGDDGEE